VCGRWIGNQETKKWTRGGAVIGWRGSSIIFGLVCPCALLVSPSQANTSHSLTGKYNVVTTKLKFLKNCTASKFSLKIEENIDSFEARKFLYGD
jgi:hypothetical protein